MYSILRTPPRFTVTFVANTRGLETKSHPKKNWRSTYLRRISFETPSLIKHPQSQVTSKITTVDVLIETCRLGSLHTSYVGFEGQHWEPLGGYLQSTDPGKEERYTTKRGTKLWWVLMGYDVCSQAGMAFFRLSHWSRTNHRNRLENAAVWRPRDTWQRYSSPGSPRVMLWRPEVETEIINGEVPCSKWLFVSPQDVKRQIPKMTPHIQSRRYTVPNHHFWYLCWVSGV